MQLITTNVLANHFLFTNQTCNKWAFSGIIFRPNKVKLSFRFQIGFGCLLANRSPHKLLVKPEYVEWNEGVGEQRLVLWSHYNAFWLMELEMLKFTSKWWQLPKKEKKMKKTHNGTRVAVLLFWVSTGKCSVDQCYEICLFGARVRKAQSTLSALTGLSMHCTPCFCISCASVFAWHEWERWMYSWQLVWRHTYWILAI